MRFLANENFPGTAVAALIAAGHDIVWVRNAAPGMSDPDVLAWAARDERTLLTFDKDFGELVRASSLPRTCGVVLFRMPMLNPGDIGSRLSNLIMSRDDWAGHFSIIEPGRIRMRRLG
jgi:predicted nuclease of predicted toxin-antitoxin system